MEIDLVYQEQKDALGLPCHYFSNDNVIIVTFNKGASRFLSRFFKKDVEASLTFDLDFNILEHSVNPQNFWVNNIGTTEIISEWESVKSLTTDKHLIFLYRDPFKRLLTGLVQEYYTAMLPQTTQTYPYNFTLKKFLHQYDGGADTYNFIVSGKFDNLFIGEGGESPINNYRVERALVETFEDFLQEISQTPITFMQHTNLYFVYLNAFVNELKDFDNMKIFNLDNKEINLEEYIQQYLNLEELEMVDITNPTNSNRWFLDKIYTRITNVETKHDFNIIFKLFTNAINPDLVAYKQLKRLKCNIT